MSITVAFVFVFAAVCVFLTGLAIIRIWKTADYPNKPLWIAGCFLGFVGFALNPASGDDLLMHFGIQLPVVYGTWSGVEGLALKASFPVIAAMALFRLKRFRVEEKPLD